MQASRVESGLRPLQEAAWVGFLRAHALLVSELDDDLQAAHGLPLREYEVLLMLARADDGMLRMTELANAVLLSQSGLTRLVDRLERRGLVTRLRCPTDKRGLLAAVTAAGRARLEEARPTHLDGVRSRFLSHFSDDELEGLAAAWERVLPPVSPSA